MPKNENAWTAANKLISSERDAGDPIATWKRESALHAAVQESIEEIDRPELKAERRAWESISESIGHEQPQALTMINGKLAIKE